MHTDSPPQNYCNKSFRRKDLTGQDLSNADITGADFSEAILVGADLSYSKTGVKKNWRLIHRVLLIILTA